MSRFAAPIAEQIWDMKYRLKKADGTVIDETVEDTWRRIANALAGPEMDQEKWSQEFYTALEDFKFIPAGRIVAGAGTGRNVTLSNCFTMGTIPDSMDGIFSHLREAALTMQAGGGIGYDFSTIRPKGSHVKGVDSDASGPLTFMDCWDSMCRTVMSAGSRRGAMMATMRCDHPDIEDFIAAKRDPARLRMFNVSVLVTDSFMQAVQADADWNLIFEGKIYKTVKALDLWNKIMESTYAYAEPGVIFIDRVNSMHNIWWMEQVATTNPCGEKPMGPYASCLLGSINLVKFVEKEPSCYLDFNYKELARIVRIAIRMMDNVIEAGKFPLPEQERKAKEDRQLGLGVTGLANALMMLRYRYGSDDAVAFTDLVMKCITQNAYRASIELAKEKGSFPTLDREKFLESGFMQSMSMDIRREISKHGIRNALLTSIAPTGTISLYAGNVSSGIEPVFAHSYTRKVLQPDGSKTEERVVDYAVAEFERLHPGQDLPDYFVTAQDLSPMDHVRMQAAAQRWVDSSISKTVNVPEDISFEDFKEVYIEAYHSGCKGCTTYRPNDVTGSVLSVEPKKEEAPDLSDEDKKVVQAWLERSSETRAKYERTLLDDEKGEKRFWLTSQPDVPARPEAMTGKTYKMKWPGYNHAIYITINDDADGNPFELFFNTKGIEHTAWMGALSRTISAVFRRGGDVRFIAQELKEVFDPKGGAYLDGKYVPSMIAQIGSILERHMKGDDWNADEIAVQDEAILSNKPTPPQCPACGEFAMVMKEGCMTCNSCGYSKCG